MKVKYKKVVIKGNKLTENSILLAYKAINSFCSFKNDLIIIKPNLYMKQLYIAYQGIY